VKLLQQHEKRKKAADTEHRPRKKVTGIGGIQLLVVRRGKNPTTVFHPAFFFFKKKRKKQEREREKTREPRVSNITIWYIQSTLIIPHSC
jgi:hypothetical protein